MNNGDERFSELLGEADRLCREVADELVRRRQGMRSLEGQLVRCRRLRDELWTMGGFGPQVDGGGEHH